MKDRYFIFAVSGQDQCNKIQQGNFYLTSCTGKITKKDIDFVLKEYSIRLASLNVIVNPEKCMVHSIFELDAL